MPGLETDDGFLVRMISQPPTSMKDTPMNKARWKKIGKGYYFILRRFEDEASDIISHGLTRPDSFCFTNAGNLRCLDSDGIERSFRNPTDPNEFADYVESLSFLKRSNDLYEYDQNKVISVNLLYILHRDSANDNWCLLYNPMHRKAFGKHYADILEIAKPNNITWGKTKRTDAHMSVNALLHNYCDAFQVQRTDGKTAYLDPTCNMVLSGQQCGRSAFFGTNRVKYSEKEANRKGNRTVIDSLTAGDVNGIPRCVSMGKTFGYVDSYVPETSFIKRFMRPLDPETGKPQESEGDINNVVCNMTIEAKHVEISNSQFYQDCDMNVQDPPLSPVPLEPVQPAEPEPSPQESTDTEPPPESDKAWPFTRQQTMALAGVAVGAAACTAFVLSRNKKKSAASGRVAPYRPGFSDPSGRVAPQGIVSPAAVPVYPSIPAPEAI